MKRNKRMIVISFALLMLTALLFLDVLPTAAQEEVSVFNTHANYNLPPVGHRNIFIGGQLPSNGWVVESLTHHNLANASYTEGIAIDWTLSEDYMTSTLRIREGVLFNDGTELTAKDIVATFYSGIYLFKMRPWPGNLLKEIEVVDDYNLIFHHGVPNDRVPFYVLWHYDIVPYSQYGTFSDRVLAKIAQGYDIFNNPEEFEDIRTELNDYRPDKIIGTGPYIEKSMTDVEIVLEKFEDYWNGVPPIDEIHIKNTGGVAEVFWSLMLDGELDWYWGTPTPEQLADLETKPFAEIIRIGRPMGACIHFNFKIYPLNVKEVRQAIAYAVNRSELAYIQYPIGAPAEEYIIGTSSYYVDQILSESFIDEYLEDFAYEYDPEKAEGILQDLGYTKGTDGIYVTQNGTKLEFTLTGGGSWLIPEAMEATAAMLGEIGIKVNVKVIDYATWAATDGPFYMGGYEMGTMFGFASPSFTFEEHYIKYTRTFPGHSYPIIQSVPWRDTPVNLTELTMRINLFPAEVSQEELTEIYETLCYVTGDQVMTIPLFQRPVAIVLNKAKFSGWPSKDDMTYWGSYSSYAARGRSYLFRWGVLKPLLELTVNIEPSGGGTTSPSAGTFTYMKGETVTFTASAASGYAFQGWELDGAEVSTATSYTVTMDRSHTLTALFEERRMPIELYAAAGVVVVVVVAGVVYYLRKRKT